MKELNSNEIGQVNGGIVFQPSLLLDTLIIVVPAAAATFAIFGVSTIVGAALDHLDVKQGPMHDGLLGLVTAAVCYKLYTFI